MVSHDRYFMDKTVDHLLVFNGQGDIRDFPGNYTQYREWKEAEERHKRATLSPTPQEAATRHRHPEGKRKLSFKEKRELDQLEQDINALETEKRALEEALCSGTLSVELLTEYSKRLPVLTSEIDEKTIRWMELSEIENP